VSHVQVNDDGTVDWCGLTGWDLAAVFRSFARPLADDDHAADLALEAVGGCMALWESKR
jgi:hypothetical protein